MENMTTKQKIEKYHKLGKLKKLAEQHLYDAKKELGTPPHLPLLRRCGAEPRLTGPMVRRLRGTKRRLILRKHLYF